MGGFVQANPFADAPFKPLFCAAFFVVVQIATVPGVRAIGLICCGVVEQIGDVVDLTAGVFCVVQFNGVVQHTVGGAAPFQVGSHAMVHKLPGVAHKTAVVVGGIRPVG